MSLSSLLFVALIALAPFTRALDGDTFTTNCAPLSIQRSDPILNAGMPGGHVHSIIGGNAFSRKMAMFDARNANATTCNKALDHSNYWVPQLYHQRADGTFEMVKYTGSAVYYQKRACNYSATAKNCDKSFVPLAPPDGFRMIAGDATRRTQNDADFAQRAVAMMCLETDTSKEYHGFPPVRCNNLRAEVYFPSCWNGKDLDPADHQSHVSYPAIGDYNGGVCPQTHPVAIFSIFFEFFFDVSPYTDINRFVFAQGDPTGFGFHGDFVMGWTDRAKLQTAHADCVNAQDCPTLGNQPAVAQKLIYPAIFEEDIGLNGPIRTLPGNNPVKFPDTMPGYESTRNRDHQWLLKFH